MSISSLELRENRALDYFQNIVETVREPLIVLDSDLRVQGLEGVVNRGATFYFSTLKQNAGINAH